MMEIDSLQDRGEAKHFHGREPILRTFRKEMRLAEETASGGGTIILVQGPPGAGKTALLEECKKKARRRLQPWRVADIGPSALRSPASLMSALREQYEKEKTATYAIGIPKVAHAEWRALRQPTGDTILSMLRKASAGGLLLVLDEAQALRHYGAAEIVADDIGHTLNHIHNGNVGEPVILLAGGLGNSAKAFADLDISRFKGGCEINLGRLSREAEGAVIRDWLTKDGKAKGDTEPWIQAIAKEAHGWPQHIIAFAQPAVESLRENGGEMTSAGLKEVVESGRIRKEEYYSARAGGLTNVDIIDIAKATKFFSPEGDITEAGLLHRLSLRHTRKDPHTLFNHLVHKGIIAEQRKGWYAIPIPSLKDWLVENGRAFHRDTLRAGLDLDDGGLEM